MRLLLSCLFFLGAFGTFGAFGASPVHADELRIGSKRFTESYILAELLAGSAASSGTTTKILPGLGNTAIVYEALRAGNIDLYPEYTGTIVQEILKKDGVPSLAEINRELAPLNLGAAISFGFNDGYALAMREADAARLGIRTLSDLARHAELKFGLSNEFIGRRDGWRGLAARYGFVQIPAGLDHGLAYGALASGRIDVTDIYTTDAQIGHLGLRVLIDDQRHFPRYDAVVLYRLDVPARFPQAWERMTSLTARVDEAAMIRMNARAELDGIAFDVIARDFLAGDRKGMRVANSAGITAAAGPTPARSFVEKLSGEDFGRLTVQHLFLVAVSVGVATLIAVPLGVMLFPQRRLCAAILALTGLLQTVPSLALLAALIGLTGTIGAVPALTALTLYALLPVMRNTCAGLAQVPEGLRQAAVALGMSRRDTLMAVELPLALPTIVAGIRTAAAIAVGTATIAAFIGAGGYGERIVTGLALNDGGLMLAGAIPAAMLALVCELAFEGLERSLARRLGRAPVSG